MQKAYKNLLTNSFLFTLANLGSKVITFIMVPLYTYVLSPTAYGTIDLITTTSSLMIPIVFLCISDAVMRYTMAGRFDRKDVLSNGLRIYLQGLAVAFLALFLIDRYLGLGEYKFFLILLLGSNGLLLIFNQFLRSVDKIKEFAFNGVLYTAIFVISNVVFLIGLKWGVRGYFCSMILANAVCIVYAIVMSKAWKYLTKKPSKSTLRVMLKYALPLIPNSLMWWVMDASDKYVLAYFLGVNANGIYAISKKLPTIIDTFHGIFNQAWQISAIQENDSDGATQFTSNVYKIYTILVFGVVSVLLIAARPITRYLLSAEYVDSWKYIPLLLISVAFSGLSGVLGANFIANENTGIIFRTTVYGAVVNTVLNFVLIPLMGINGAALATAIGFFVVLFIREKRIRKKGDLIVGFNRTWLLVLMSIEIVVYYLLPMWAAIVSLIFLTLILGICYRGIFFETFTRGIRQIRRKGKEERRE